MRLFGAQIGFGPRINPYEFCDDPDKDPEVMMSYPCFSPIY